MKNELYVREILLAETHHWWKIFGFGLIGCLIGLVVSLLWQSPYRATKELYIGLNIQNMVADANATDYVGTHFSNANDYKNWQMANLNTVVHMQPIIDETLATLRTLDPYWESVSSSELSSMLHVYWRNAGKWRLVAQSDDPQRAREAVEAWESTVLSHAHSAIEAAFNGMVAYTELRQVMGRINDLQMKISTYEQLHASLIAWQEALETLPESSPLNERDRQSIWHQLNITDLGTAWKPMLESFPQPSATSVEYKAWLSQAIALLEANLSQLTIQRNGLEAQKQQLSETHSQAVNTSLGLSAELLIDKIDDTPPEVDVIRPVGLAMLIGSILGFLSWAFSVTVKISRL